jgi:hypothetical protein
MDWVLIEQKLESLRRSVRRVKEKCPENAAAIANNYDAQDILSLNISCAAIIRRMGGQNDVKV